MSPPRKAITKERLLSRIKEVPGRLDTPCWEWQGAKLFGKYKYGVLAQGKINRTQNYVHRCSFHLFKGPIPDGCSVLHHCDNPPCINPDHLFAGTRGENCTDCAKKDRHARGMRNWHAKLTDNDVLAIRASTEIAQTVADRYGVHINTIYYIRWRQTWKHLK